MREGPLPPPAAVLGTPELLCQIFDDAAPSDLAQLCRTSRLFFSCASPPLWKDAKGVLKLLNTIPRLELSTTSIYSMHHQATGLVIQKLKRREVLINLPETLDLTRFNYYASLVRRLQIFDNSAVLNYFLGLGWDNLVKYQATRADGLTPNLISLSLVNTPNNQSNYAWSVLTKLFISSRLEELRIPHFVGENGLSSSQVCSPESTVYKTLARCPANIHTLQLLHTSCVYSFDCLVYMRTLRHLETLIDIVYDHRILAILGGLPNLETLALHDYAHYNRSIDAPVLSSKAFPALRTLKVTCAFPSAAEVIWSIIPMVTRLTTVDFKIHYKHYSARTNPVWVTSIIQCICTGSPGLLDLRLHIRGQREYRISLTSTHLELLATLRLRRVSLVHIVLMKAVPFTDFVSSFPDAEEFRYTSETIDFYDLHQLAVHMPCLKHLAIQSVRKYSRPFSVGDIVAPASNQMVILESSWNNGRDLSKGLEDTAV
ncbi:hypothetical protein FRC09_019531 [Ceratobasidium sp. 395]|nr:hypothetical protein FRC09_019531 [Ceratobasidium sp. 395]